MPTVAESTVTNRYALYDLRGSTTSSLPDEVRVGLTSAAKTLPPKYFYDEKGSQLFEKICKTPEYYPARAEHGLLKEHAESIVRCTGSQLFAELGSGSSSKTQCLLDAAARTSANIHYVPIDVCCEMLEDASERLLARYPGLIVTALAGDYVSGLQHVPDSRAPRLFMFLGGTIGNFERDESHEFALTVADCMEKDDWFLLGADRVKDEAVLNAAYNDAQGITAEFNLNILRVLNRELGADFDLDAFTHEAFFNPEKAQIEMHLRSCKYQTVFVSELMLEVEFAENETVRTEISRKFTPDTLDELCSGAGMSIERHYESENGYFSLVLARKN